MVAMTSALPSVHPLRDDVGHTVAETPTTTTKRAKLTHKTVTESGGDCPRGYYFSEEEAMGCTRCSVCPVNQIILHPCSARADTKCGPFLEFSKFHQSPAVEKSPSKTTEEKGDGSAHQEPRRTAQGASGSGDGADQWSVARLERAAGQWRTLSFALIAVLSVICCLVVIVALYVCFLLRRSAHATQKIFFRESEMMAPQSYPAVDPEPRYVDLYATSLGYGRTLPRHLHHYQQILTGCDASEVLPSTPLASDLKDEVLSSVDEGDYVSVYVNAAALDAKDP
ncbi:hypothetical protein ACOMHN_037562 [Nucella lapillus]